MSRISSIGTALPAYCHRQQDILSFMQMIYTTDETEKRKLRFLYSQSGIDKRYSVIADYGRPALEWKFFPAAEGLEPFPSIEKRMELYNRFAPQLSVDAIRNCLGRQHSERSLTHLITVSCTGMSAPGLDLQLVELLNLDRCIARTSVNFMGCYAAIHALKMADAICRSAPGAKVLIVCTELCTLHFQREATPDNIASSLLFGDGVAAVLVESSNEPGLVIESFYSEVIPGGRRDMAWELSSTGFLMTLSNYIPELIEQDFPGITERMAANAGIRKEQIAQWCIHPGGRRILDAIARSLQLKQEDLSSSYDVLKQYGNLSSATLLFVLKKMMENRKEGKIMGAAFGPGLTVETFLASYQ